MDYAMKSLSLLTPTTLSKCVSSSVSASAQMLSGRTPRSKPFRVSSADRSVKKGIMADGLQDLINKVMDSLHVSCVSALVLDEDGTGIDTEEFFQTLPENAVLMVLEKTQKWTPSQISPPRVQHIERRAKQRKDLAKVTFDLYKNHPKDFIGCLSMKATLYGVYSMTYDLNCCGTKKMFKEFLRWAVFSMQTTGHLLLGSSGYIEQLLEEEQQQQAAQGKLRHTQEGRVKQLQSILLGKVSQ